MGLWLQCLVKHSQICMQSVQPIPWKEYMTFPCYIHFSAGILNLASTGDTHHTPLPANKELRKLFGLYLTTEKVMTIQKLSRHHPLSDEDY